MQALLCGKQREEWQRSAELRVQKQGVPVGGVALLPSDVGVQMRHLGESDPTSLSLSRIETDQAED